MSVAISALVEVSVARVVLDDMEVGVMVWLVSCVLRASLWLVASFLLLGGNEVSAKIR